MSGRSNGMSPFRAGILALVIVGLFTYFGFTKANPFANPYEFKAVVQRREQPEAELAGPDRRRGGGQGQEGRAHRRTAKARPW